LAQNSGVGLAGLSKLLIFRVIQGAAPGRALDPVICVQADWRFFGNSAGGAGQRVTCAEEQAPQVFVAAV
jgi:hypothetical protein